jgi:NADPH:quinone reductase-like Zn-dependent oxidoreductase
MVGSARARFTPSAAGKNRRSGMEMMKAALGADKVLDYTKRESAKYLEVYDFVLDTVGKRKSSELKKACGNALAKGGVYASIDDGALLLRSDRLNRIAELVESGIIRPVTDRIFPFERIAEAHAYVETGHKRGNVAITVNKTA